MYVSEGRALYEDYNHGRFSKSLAEWAIGNMSFKDAAGRTQKLSPTTIEDVEAKMSNAGLKVDEKDRYTAWYLYNMARADYQKTLQSDAQRATFVYETIYDPDCSPEAVLECFTAKMCTMRVPIHWEERL